MRVYPDKGPKGEVARIRYKISANRSEIAAYVFFGDDDETMNLFANQALAKKYRHRPSFTYPDINKLVEIARKIILERVKGEQDDSNTNE